MSMPITATANIMTKLANTGWRLSNDVFFCSFFPIRSVRVCFQISKLIRICDISAVWGYDVPYKAQGGEAPEWLNLKIKR
jgi:hypothetical protein